MGRAASFIIWMVLAGSVTSAALAAEPAAPTEAPPSQFVIGKFSLGMSLDKALAIFGDPGQIGKDEHGGTYHAYSVSKAGGYFALLTAPFRPSYVYGIQISGGSDVKMAPFLGLQLGDPEDAVLKHVGLPATKKPEPELKRTLWTYPDRNYSFEVDDSRHLVSILVYGYDGTMVAMNWGPNWDLYHPNSITQVIDDDRSCWDTTDVCIAAGGVRLRPRVTYTGEVRDTPADTLETFGYWMKSSPSNFTIDMVKKSMKVVEDNKEYWVAVQPQVLTAMQAEVKPGDSIDLFAIWVGAEHKGAVKALVVNDYCFCEWVPKK